MNATEEWLKLHGEYEQRPKSQTKRDPDKVAHKLAESLDRQRVLESKFRAAFNRWDKQRRVTVMLEKELDKLSELAK
jgi:hypothetical protein